MWKKSSDFGPRSMRLASLLPPLLKKPVVLYIKATRKCCKFVSICVNIFEFVDLNAKLFVLAIRGQGN
jgi:hypothetical protein